MYARPVSLTLLATGKNVSPYSLITQLNQNAEKNLSLQCHIPSYKSFDISCVSV